MSPRVVAIGGGHGLAATIRAVRRFATRTTAVVATADDGGSSGRLRRHLDVPAPGDLRRCLLAMAGDDSGVWGDALAHRFEAGELEGHALGNLVLATLTEVTGDLLEACDRVAGLLGIDPDRGRVLPATTTPVVLCAETHDGLVRGQVEVQHSTGIERVFLEPADVSSPPAVADDVGAADLVVIGPGSLYTSVLAALAAPDVTRAVAASPARRVFVANLHADEHETRGYDVAAHVAALRRHGVAIDLVLAHRGGLPLGRLDVPVVEADVARPNGRAHDGARLGDALAAV